MTFGIFVVMLWVATGRSAYLVLGVLLFAVGAGFGYLAFDHVQDRVTVWLNVFHPDLIRDEGFQLAQSLFAMATGGIAGTGLGQGQPGFIPDAHTDFVFSAIGEELGLLGTMAVLLLFVLLIFRGFKAALRSPDGFGQLLAAGLAAILGLQTFVIIGGVTRLIPLTGTGIVLQLEDSVQPVAPGADQADYLVGARDLRSVVEELWAAGAEAIAINGERITPTTAIIDVGPSILVNAAYLAGPYQVTALGPDDLYPRLGESAGFVDMIRTRAQGFGIQVSIAEPEAVDIPAFAGTVRPDPPPPVRSNGSSAGT